MAHTPGDWKAEPAGNGAAWAINSSIDNNRWSAIADVLSEPLGSREVSADEAKANARLIASAPDLLAAMKDLLAVIAADSLIPESVSYMQQARAAIAKARGGAA